MNEMGEYVNAKTEANSNKPDENPYVEPNDPNSYLLPNVPKYVIERVCNVILIMKLTVLNYIYNNIRNKVYLGCLNSQVRSNLQYVLNSR